MEASTFRRLLFKYGIFYIGILVISYFIFLGANEYFKQQIFEITVGYILCLMIFILYFPFGNLINKFRNFIHQRLNTIYPNKDYNPNFMLFFTVPIIAISFLAFLCIDKKNINRKTSILLKFPKTFTFCSILITILFQLSLISIPNQYKNFEKLGINEKIIRIFIGATSGPTVQHITKLNFEANYILAIDKNLNELDQSKYFLQFLSKHECSSLFNVLMHMKRIENLINKNEMERKIAKDNDIASANRTIRNLLTFLELSIEWLEFNKNVKPNPTGYSFLSYISPLYLVEASLITAVESKILKNSNQRIYEQIKKLAEDLEKRFSEQDGKFDPLLKQKYLKLQSRKIYKIN